MFNGTLPILYELNCMDGILRTQKRPDRFCGPVPSLIACPSPSVLTPHTAEETKAPKDMETRVSVF